MDTHSPKQAKDIKTLTKIHLYKVYKASAAWKFPV